MSCSKRYILLTAFLLVLCYIAFFYRLGAYGLWDPDEGRSGVIAKEILASGNWLTLTENGKPYYDKPAPYFWLLALGLKLLGLSELAVRLPSALAASLTVGAVYLWCSIHGKWKQGLWGAVVLATSFEFVGLGRFGKMDMLFTLFFTASLLYFLWWREEPKRGIWLFYLFLALALLTKGPAGVLLPLLIVGVDRIVKKDLTVFWKMRLVQGITIILLVAGPWYLLATIQDQDYIKTFIWQHNVLRFFTSQGGIDHVEPFYYLILITLAGFLPWSFFLPPLFHYLWESRRERGNEQRVFFLIWAACVLIFFSLSHNKLGTYVLPALPPLALLTGDLLQRFFEGREASTWRRRWVFLAGISWLLLLFVAPPLSDWLLGQRYPKYFPLDMPLFPAVSFLALAGIASLLGQKRCTPWLVSLSSLWLIGWFYGVKAGEISETRGTRSLTEIVREHAPENVRIVALQADSFSFYLPHRVREVPHQGVVQRMLAETTPTVALVKEKHLKELQELPASKLYVWKRVLWGNAVVANFPPDSKEAVKH